MDKRQVLEMFSHRLRIAKVMELGNESVMKLVKFSAPHLAQYDRLNVLQVSLEWCLVNLHRCRLFAIRIGLPWNSLSWWEYNIAVALEL